MHPWRTFFMSPLYASPALELGDHDAILIAQFTFTYSSFPYYVVKFIIINFFFCVKIYITLYIRHPNYVSHIFIYNYNIYTPLIVVMSLPNIPLQLKCGYCENIVLITKHFWKLPHVRMTCKSCDSHFYQCLFCPPVGGRCEHNSIKYAQNHVRKQSHLDNVSNYYSSNVTTNDL